MYILIIIGDIAWIAQYLQNIEDSIFGPKPVRNFNLDNCDFDVVDNNDNIPSNIEILNLENV